MKIADVNWLLSAVAQSGAALVAIVGGLLVSRYVALHAEQQSAKRRVADAERRHSSACAAHDQTQLELDEYRAEEILDDYRTYEEILESKDSTTIDQILQTLDVGDGGVPRELLEQRLALIRSELQRAAKFLTNAVPVENEHPSWAEFRRKSQLDPVHVDVWEWLYDRLVEIRSKEARRPQSGRLGPLAIDPKVLFPINPQVTAIHGLGSATARRNYEERLTRYRDDARRERQITEAELRLAQEHSEDVRQPEGFALALKVLTYLAVVAIGVPVMIMAAGPLTLSLWVRLVVVGLFFSGLTLLLLFLFVYASYLSEGSARSSLPRGIRGLVMPPFVVRRWERRQRFRRK